MRNLVLLFALVLCSCVVRARRPVEVYPPPPPAPVVVEQQLMSYDEAVGRSMDFAHERGYDVRLKDAHMTGDGVWKVQLDAAHGGEGHGHIKLDWDARTRQLLRSQEHWKEHGHKDDEREDDDEEHERVHGHGHGNH